MASINKDMAALKLLSYNVRGLNVPAKRHVVMRELRRLGSSVVFLQETHLTHQSMVRLYSPFFPKWYFGLSDNNKAKGVAIGFSRDIVFQLVEMIADDAGRYLFLKGTIENSRCTFANIYCPNIQQISFMSKGP